jgi:hypothetical protein
MANKNSLVRTPPATGVPAWIDSLREAMFDAIKEEDIRQMMQTIVEKAKAGDAQSQKMVFEYVLGGGVKKIVNNNLIVPPAEAEPPPAPIPTRALPRSPEKLDVLAQRVRNGQALHHPADAGHGE